MSRICEMRLNLEMRRMVLLRTIIAVVGQVGLQAGRSGAERSSARKSWPLAEADRPQSPKLG